MPNPSFDIAWVALLDTQQTRSKIIIQVQSTLFLAQLNSWGKHLDV